MRKHETRWQNESKSKRNPGLAGTREEGATQLVLKRGRVGW